MGQISPTGTHHYVAGGIKDESLSAEKYARALFCMRVMDFEDGNEINTETDEGHTGASTLDMGSYRTEATSSPSWSDKLRYKEGLEETFYLLLGNYTKSQYEQNSTAVNGVNLYHYDFPPTNAKDLPLMTIYNGFSKTDKDGRVWNNAMLNEFTMNFSNSNAPTMDLSFVSDYNNFNMLNPTRSYASATNFVRVDQVNIYIGEVGANETAMRANPVNCFIESSFTINNNAETQSCVEDEFGKNSKFMGVRETTGSVNMPWNDNTKLLEPEYEGADKLSHIVSTDITNKQIWYEMIGAKIGETDARYSTLIKFPEIEVTNVTSPKSGEDAKDLTMEYKVLENPTQSFMTVDLVSDLDKLRIDTEGVDLSDIVAEMA